MGLENNLLSRKLGEARIEIIRLPDCLELPSFDPVDSHAASPLPGEHEDNPLARFVQGWMMDLFAEFRGFPKLPSGRCFQQDQGMHVIGPDFNRNNLFSIGRK